MSAGDKAKYVNLLDSMMSESVDPLYSLEVHIAISEKKRKFCGGFYVFRLQSLGHDDSMDDLEWVKKFDPAMIDQVRQATANQTDQVVYFEKFREQDGQDVEWVPGRALEIFDSFCKSHAKIKIVAAELGAEEWISYDSVVRRRSDPQELFSRMFEWYRLLKDDYSYDPWVDAIKRGLEKPENSSR